MKVFRTFFWIIVAIIFGAVAGVIIGSITLAAGLLILRDAIFHKPTTDNQ